MSLKTFETDLLVTFLKDEKTYLKFSSRIKPEHFRNKILRFMYEVLCDYYNGYKQLPDVKVFKNELLKSGLDSDKKKLYFATVKKVLKRKPKTSQKYIEDNVQEKVEQEELLISLDKAVHDLEKDGVPKAKATLLRDLLLRDKDDHDPDPMFLFRDWKLRQQLRKKLSKIPLRKRFIATPYSPINVVTQGIQAGEAATIAGLTGLGKSIIAGEFGAVTVLDAMNVLHITTENTSDQTAQRYDSRLSQLEYDTIKLYKFTPNQLKSFRKIFTALTAAMENDVVIKEAVRNKTDIVYIDKLIRSLRGDGFNTELLIVDSCDIMASSVDMRDYRLDRASVYWDFKDYCKINRLPGLTTTQLKSSAKWQIATSEDLAEAYDKARILDIVYIMSQTEEDFKRGTVKFSLDKNRDGVGGIVVTLYKDSARMRFLEVSS